MMQKISPGEWLMADRVLRWDGVTELEPIIALMNRDF